MIKKRGVHVAASFITRVRYLREKNFLKQSDVAAVLQMSTRGYQRYEIGDTKPSLDVLLELADYFNVSLDYLTGRTKDPAVHMPDDSDDVQLPLQEAI